MLRRKMRRAIRSAGRILIRSLLVLVVLFLTLCTAGELRQRVLVHRASALLSDLHSLRLYQSTWQDAQRMMTRWGGWGHYDGACTPADCMYVITLHDITAPAGSISGWPSRPMFFLSSFRLLPRQWGGGLRVMQAMFLVQDGLIVRSGISIDMTQSPLAKGAEPVCCGAELILSVRSQGSLSPVPGWAERERSRHPDYTVWRPGGCTFCLMGRVTYASTISPQEAARLSDFQLSCATRWSSCLTLEELDPAAHAWHLYGPPWGDPEEPDTRPIPAECSLPLYSLGRDARSILSVEALEDGAASHKDHEDTESEKSRVRILETLKGEPPTAIGSIRDIVSSAASFGDQPRKPPHIVKGKRYLLMPGADETGVNGFTHITTCGILEDNADSRHELLRGMSMERPLKGFEPAISLGGFVRHAPTPWDH